MAQIDGFVQATASALGADIADAVVLLPGKDPAWSTDQNKCANGGFAF
ncbi:hypothetical protein [uncultured Desulfosarcina sp.]|nr:hypothetical protein [uncultured Desulfosarcina sp.]